MWCTFLLGAGGLSGWPDFELLVSEDLISGSTVADVTGSFAGAGSWSVGAAAIAGLPKETDPQMSAAAAR